MYYISALKWPFRWISENKTWKNIKLFAFIYTYTYSIRSYCQYKFTLRYTNFLILSPCHLTSSVSSSSIYYYYGDDHFVHLRIFNMHKKQDVVLTLRHTRTLALYYFTFYLINHSNDTGTEFVSKDGAIFCSLNKIQIWNKLRSEEFNFTNVSNIPICISDWQFFNGK